MSTSAHGIETKWSGGPISLPPHSSLAIYFLSISFLGGFVFNRTSDYFSLCCLHQRCLMPLNLS
jgi:hypothetical protein